MADVAPVKHDLKRCPRGNQTTDRDVSPREIKAFARAVDVLVLKFRPRCDHNQSWIEARTDLFELGVRKRLGFDAFSRITGGKRDDAVGQAVVFADTPMLNSQAILTGYSLHVFF